MFRKIIWGLLKAHSQTWFSEVSSGNAPVDNTHGSWTFWRVLRVWVPLERWGVAGGGFIILHLPHHSVLSDLEFHIHPGFFVCVVFLFFNLMLNPCGWIFKIWLEKMQIYWALPCQMRKFLGNWEGDPEFNFFSCSVNCWRCMVAAGSAAWGEERREEYLFPPFLLQFGLLPGLSISWTPVRSQSFWASWAQETQLKTVIFWATEQRKGRERHNLIWGQTD